MKKAILILILCVSFIFLSGCLNSNNELNHDELNHDTLKRLLRSNGFSNVDTREGGYNILTVRPRVINASGELLVVYEFDSNEEMRSDASLVDRDGARIERPAGGWINMTWNGTARWFKGGRIIVIYTGHNEEIINFLMDNLELFAGEF